MGVRFPIQQQRPDFGQMQQADNTRQAVPPQQQEVQATGQPFAGQAQEPDEQNAILETQETQNPLQQTPAERAADDAGAQTPGSIIDMLA